MAHEDAERLLKTFEGLTDYLGLALGPHHEVVLQDLTEGAYCIRRIAGEPLTGRAPGSPLTDLAMAIVNGGTWRERDSICGYEGQAIDGRTLSCSTYFIKLGDELVGMLCINRDRSAYERLSREILELGSPLRAEGASSASAGATGKALPSGVLASFGAGMGDGMPSPADGTTGAAFASSSALTPHREALASSPSPLASGVTERFFRTHEDIVDDAVRRVRPEGADGPFAPDERQQVVAELDAMGFFMMRGSVRLVADRLGCSVPSVYRYRQQAQASA